MAELVQYSSGVPALRFKIDRQVIRIGRSADNNDVCILDSHVSKEHASIEARASKSNPELAEFYLRDLGSTNHTDVNKQEVRNHKLENDDMIYIGQHMFRFVCSENEKIKGLTDEDETVEFEKKGYQRSFSRRLRMIY